MPFAAMVTGRRSRRINKPRNGCVRNGRVSDVGTYVKGQVANGPPCERNISLSASDNGGTNLLSTNDVSVHCGRDMLPNMFGLVDVSFFHGWHVNPQTTGEMIPRGDIKPVPLKTACSTLWLLRCCGVAPAVCWSIFSH